MKPISVRGTKLKVKGTQDVSTLRGDYFATCGFRENFTSRLLIIAFNRIANSILNNTFISLAFFLLESLNGIVTMLIFMQM